MNAQDHRGLSRLINTILFPGNRMRKNFLLLKLIVSKSRCLIAVSMIGVLFFCAGRMFAAASNESDSTNIVPLTTNTEMVLCPVVSAAQQDCLPATLNFNFNSEIVQALGLFVGGTINYTLANTLCSNRHDNYIVFGGIVSESWIGYLGPSGGGTGGPFPVADSGSITYQCCRPKMQWVPYGNCNALNPVP